MSEISSSNNETHRVAFYKNKNIILAFFWVLFFILWFMPTPEGLTTGGKHAIAVVILTVGIWISNAVPASVGSLIMLGIVLVFMPHEVPPGKLLEYWTQDTMWFILVCFSFEALMRKSGLGNRLATYVFSIRSLLLVDIAMFLVNILFSIVGMASSFPKLALLFPLLVSIGTLSGMPKNDPYIKHVALMINMLANVSGFIIYTGFAMNPMLGSLGGFEVNYLSWIQMFFVPALAVNILIFFLIYFLFRPQKGSQGFNADAAREIRSGLGPLTLIEYKTIFWLTAIVLLWATGSITGIPAGYAAVLVTGLVMLPWVGVINFKEFSESTNWSTIFMVMGVFAFSALGITGFTTWIWDKILPATLPESPIVKVMLLSFIVEVMHIPLGSMGTTIALAIPSLSALNGPLGLSRELISIVAYLSIGCQGFFPYQNVVWVAGLGYGLWEPKDLMKVGIVLFFLLPVVLGLILFPYWVYMGWIH